MRHTYIVTYDISDPKRLRKTHRLLLGYGDPIQYSVFQCDLNQRELIELRVRLSEIIHHKEDQVLLASLGPAQGRAQTAIQSLGKVYQVPEQLAVVV